MPGECSGNNQYRGIIHYKLRAVFYLESLLLTHWGHDIIPGMNYFSVHRACMGPRFYLVTSIL